MSGAGRGYWQRPIPKQSTVDSPCIRNCCLDEQDVCMGCGRHLQEIMRWQSSSLAEREQILAAARIRLAEIKARRRW